MEVVILDDKYNKEAIKLRKWFAKEKNLGATYDECIDKLIGFRKQGSSDEVEIYEIFCFMSDNIWEDIRSEFDENYEEYKFNK